MQLVPHFLEPSIEDPMELTPDMDQPLGGADDIDLDLDLTGDNQHHGEDEFMDEEDVNFVPNPTSALEPDLDAVNDDEMTDHSYAQGLIDEGSSVPDEAIDDAEYTGPHLDEDRVVEADPDRPDAQKDEKLANYEELIGQPSHDQYYEGDEYNEEEHHEQPTKRQTEFSLIKRANLHGRTELAEFHNVATKVATEKTLQREPLAINKEATVNPDAPDQTSRTPNANDLVAAAPKLEQIGEGVLPISLNVDVLATPKVEDLQTRGEDISNSTAHLHPIILDYQGDEMFLFPPVDQDGEHAATFLLADERFAYGTVEQLLDACRCILKGSLSEQDELMINIHDLNLEISESTVECTSTRLSEILDLYLRLQQNDGLENPPPLYMDLTARKRLSSRIDILRNASVEGTGLSQLKSPQESEIGRQNSLEEVTDTSNYTTVLSVNETYALEQQAGEEADGSMDKYSSHRQAPPPEHAIPEADSGTQGTQSDLVKDAAHEQNHRAVALPGDDSSAHGSGVSANLGSDAAESEESLEPAQVLTNGSELPRAQETLVDEGDFIDYEDVDELKGTSSASSTLQDDANDIHAIQYTPNEPTFVQAQEHQPSHDTDEGDVPGEKSLHNDRDHEDKGDLGISVTKRTLGTTASPPSFSDDQSQSLSRQSIKIVEATENDQDASASQNTEPHLNINADVQYEAFDQYDESTGSYWRKSLREHAEQAEDNTRSSADAFSKDEVEDYSPTNSFNSEASGSGGAYRDNDSESVNGSKAENELEEADGFLDCDDNDEVPQLLEDMHTRPSLYVGESARTQEDDDEITYEDEEYHIDTSYEPRQSDKNAVTSPGSLKRPRSLHEDDETPIRDLQDSKRIRSG